MIEPAWSKYNSPIFAVAKKNGGIQLVQDFRALNAETHINKYCMRDVTECVGEIGRSGSTIFLTLDLTAGFWQMLLETSSQPYTAFTVPGQGQFQWVTSPMGLLGCPASFQLMMEAIVKGLDGIIMYIDDLLVHLDTHKKQIDLLEKLFQCLVQNGIKVNLDKCIFGNKNISYLGFLLTEKGIIPGSDKLKAIRDVAPPGNMHEVRQFLGLCNFFRTHVKNFAQISAPLTALTRKDSEWKAGPLPTDALEAFKEMQTILVSEPVMAYPRNRPYALITDASLGDSDQKKHGGLGAILTQIDKKGEHQVIANASRKLVQNEMNYTLYLLEMQAAIWAMEHFDTHLRGRHFTLFTDHRPLEKLGKVHTTTLNRLQEAMLTFDFEIVYKKGSETPANFLSRNMVVDSISFDEDQIRDEQMLDPRLQALKKLLYSNIFPQYNTEDFRFCKLYQNDSFLDNGILYRQLQRTGEPDRVVLFAPPTMRELILQEAHGAALSGHGGTLKTKERILQSYFWPGMDQDIQTHLKTCQKCQMRRTRDQTKPELLSPLPQCTQPNQRIHADLLGFLVVSRRGKKYILCIMDAFTKYVELVAIDNKEANTVAEAIFEKWFCRYRKPMEIVTDGGKEFCAKVSEELMKRMGATHLKTAHTTLSATAKPK